MDLRRLRGWLEELESMCGLSITHTHTHTHTHTPKIRTKQNKKNCFLTFHMSGWCQTLLLDSQKSLLFLCKREVLSRRECFRTLIYLEMTQLFSTLSSLSLAQDRNSGNQNTWRNDCMFSSVQWLSRVWLFVTPWTSARQASLSITNLMNMSLSKLWELGWTGKPGVL